MYIYTERERESEGEREREREREREGERERESERESQWPNSWIGQVRSGVGGTDLDSMLQMLMSTNHESFEAASDENSTR